MITAVDTNVLLDVLIPGAPHLGASRAALEACHARGGLVICEVVYAELFAQFPTPSGLETFLTSTGIRLIGSSKEALRRASEAWVDHLRARVAGRLQCPACGAVQAVSCSSCDRALGVRQHILADFLVGGHAVHHADRLLSRDRGFYSARFEDLALV